MLDARAAASMADGGVRLAVRAQPRASRNAVLGLVDAGDDTVMVKVAVTAVPEAGKANAQVIKLLAKEWGLRKTDFSVHRGATERNKVLFIAGDPDILMHTIAGRGKDESLA